MSFYLTQGVKDVLVFDPRSLAIVHARVDGTDRHLSPRTFELACGCDVQV